MNLFMPILMKPCHLDASFVKLFPELSTHLRKFVVLIHFGPKVVPRWMLEELMLDLNYMYITVG